MLYVLTSTFAVSSSISHVCATIVLRITRRSMTSRSTSPNRIRNRNRDPLNLPENPYPLPPAPPAIAPTMVQLAQVRACAR